MKAVASESRLPPFSAPPSRPCASNKENCVPSSSPRSTPPDAASTTAKVHTNPFFATSRYDGRLPPPPRDPMFGDSSTSSGPPSPFNSTEAASASNLNAHPRPSSSSRLLDLIYHPSSKDTGQGIVEFVNGFLTLPMVAIQILSG
jgi:hypothetical protein